MRGKGDMKVVMGLCRGIDPASGNPRAQKSLLERVPPLLVWDVYLDASERQGQVPSSA